jgi:cell division septation protein DedD
VSPERHFEMIVSGRQLAGLIALVAALLLSAFGLGVGVGLLQPSRTRSAEDYQHSMVSADHAATLRDSAMFPTGTPLPEPTATAGTPGVAPPVFPADIAAATPPAVPTAPVSSSPEPRTPDPGFLAPSPVPPRPTAKPPKPTATPRPKPTATPSPRSWVQIASLARADQAEGVRQRVMALGFRADQVLVLPGTGGKYRVRLGPFPGQESASRVVARLQASGFPDAFLLRE